MLIGVAVAALGACSSSSGGSGSKSKTDTTTQTGPCSNGQKDTGETDIDCGGDTCGPCALEKTCATNTDCDSGFCGPGNICWPGSCNNGEMDPLETATDCGGTDCPACAGDDWTSNDECVTGFCDAGSCATASCTDGVKNGKETGVDCAGDCPLCEDGNTCISGINCTSGFCNLQGICATAACDDGEKNGDETDVDCGGACAACEDGKQCSTGADCESTKCTAGVCEALAGSCSDGQQNDDETDVDCGGGCSPCGFGKACSVDGDCVSGSCQGGACTEAASCSDAELTPGESDVDCGGTECAPCGLGKTCKANSDCLSFACILGVCEPPSCTDEIENGDETDVDCGGPECPKCEDSKKCEEASDCEGGNCTGGFCGSCSDNVKNGDETDVDCGGACGPCGDGLSCGGPTDCASLLCDGGVCISCSDQLMNGGESDVDCGGICGPCEVGGNCGVNGDCVSGACGEDGVCCQANACGTCGAVPTEICNGIDDDCDDATDEDLAEELCENQNGVCQGTVATCQGEAGWVCDTTQYDSLEGYEADETTCDMIDNDCDGNADEPVACGQCAGALFVSDYLLNLSDLDAVRTSQDWFAVVDGVPYAAVAADIQNFSPDIRVAVINPTGGDLFAGGLPEFHAPTIAAMDGEIYLGYRTDLGFSTREAVVKQYDTLTGTTVYQRSNDVPAGNHTVAVGAGSGAVAMSYVDTDFSMRLADELVPGEPNFAHPTVLDLNFDASVQVLVDNNGEGHAIFRKNFGSGEVTHRAPNGTFTGLGVSGVEAVDAHVDALGNIHAVWVDDDANQAEYAFYDGSSWSDTEIVAATSSIYAGVAAGPSGTPYVVVRGGSNTEVAVYRRGAAGWSLVAERTMSTGSQVTKPQLEVLEGEVIVLGAIVDGLDDTVSFATTCAGYGDGCVPACAGKQCGDDGCGGSCGTCSGGQSCNAAGQCVAECTPNCSGKVCGNDGCGGSCGTCGAGQTCTSAGQCSSTTGLTCGDVGVPADTCTEEDPCQCVGCQVDGGCTAADDCVCADCASDGVCSDLNNCNDDGTCSPYNESCECADCLNHPECGGGTCTPNCTGKTCGSDGCGGSCGSCAAGQTCSAAGTCVEPGGLQCDENGANPGRALPPTRVSAWVASMMARAPHRTIASVETARPTTSAVRTVTTMVSARCTPRDVAVPTARSIRSAS